MLLEQVITGDDLLQRVGAQGVNAGQVGDGHITVASQLALLFFHSDAGPVAHVLGSAGQGVEHGRLTTVRVARKGNFNLCHSIRFLSFDAKLRNVQFLLTNCLSCF